MNKEQQQICDEAYKNFTNSLFYDFSGDVKGYRLHEHLSQEEFKTKLITDDEFNAKWANGCTRELSHKERSDLKNSPPFEYGKPANGKLIDERLLNAAKVPTRTII
jgi:hypothetical protein